MTIDTTYLDADTDNVKAARAAILAMANQLNAMSFTDPTFDGLTTMDGGQAWGIEFDNSASGSTVSIAATSRLFINIGAGTKAALTYRLPSAVNKQVVRICTDGAITALTVADSGGTTGNVLNAPTTLAVGGFCEFAYRASSAKWYRCG